MPLYKFKCEKCGHEEDLILALKDRDEPQICPQCHFQMKRQIPSSFGIAFVYDTGLVKKSFPGGKAVVDTSKNTGWLPPKEYIDKIADSIPFYPDKPGQTLYDALVEESQKGGE